MCYVRSSMIHTGATYLQTLFLQLGIHTESNKELTISMSECT